MSSFDLGSAQEILARTPATLRALLGGTSSGWTEGVTRQGSWRAFDILGHLIQGEIEDWIPCAHIILEYGEARPFQPFDRSGFERATVGKSVAELLDDFASAREENLRALVEMHLDERDLERTGTHPTFGAVTLRQMLATWVAHDLSHVAQITDSMARRYADDVGPWRRFLPVLDRPEEDSG